jgi:flagellar basal body-associated protein FliL
MNNCQERGQNEQPQEGRSKIPLSLIVLVITIIGLLVAIIAGLVYPFIICHSEKAELKARISSLQDQNEILEKTRDKFFIVQTWVIMNGSITREEMIYILSTIEY